MTFSKTAAALALPFAIAGNAQTIQDDMRDKTIYPSQKWEAIDAYMRGQGGKFEAALMMPSKSPSKDNTAFVIYTVPARNKDPLGQATYIFHGGPHTGTFMYGLLENSPDSLAELAQSMGRSTGGAIHQTCHGYRPSKDAAQPSIPDTSLLLQTHTQVEDLKQEDIAQNLRWKKDLPAFIDPDASISMQPGTYKVNKQMMFVHDEDGKWDFVQIDTTHRRDLGKKKDPFIPHHVSLCYFGGDYSVKSFDAFKQLFIGNNTSFSVYPFTPS